MNVSVVIATYGSDVWRDLGDATTDVTTSTHWAQIEEVVRRHEPDGSIAEARNQAAECATGDWLCFLDADDRLAPGYFDAMAAALDAQLFSLRNGILPALLVPAVQYVRAGQPVRPHANAEIPAWSSSLIELNCAVIGTLVPRKLFDRVGGFGDEPIYEDWALWLRCVIAGAFMVPVHDAVYVAEARLDGRNAGSESLRVYHEIRDRLERRYPWGRVRRYKLGLPAQAAS